MSQIFAPFIVLNNSETGNFSLSRRNSSNSVCFNFDNSIPTVVGQLLMSIAIIVLNLLVVAAICQNRSRTFRKPAFLFIVALAMTDMLLAICLTCFGGIAVTQLQLSASTWVNLTASTSICFNASINFLFVIALDRLCFIAYNHNYTKLMHNRNVFLLIFLCWFVGILPVLPLFFDNVGSCADLCSCYENQFLACPHASCSTVIKGSLIQLVEQNGGNLHVTVKQTYFNFILVVGFTKKFLFGMFFYFLIMLFSITAVYASIFWKVRRQANRVRRYSKESSSRGSSSRMRREYRLARTLTVVVVTFFFCWSPLVFLYVIDFATPDSFVINAITAQTVMTPAVFNSMLNPIIYAARIPILKNYFCFCGCKIKKESTTDKRSQKSSESSSRKTPAQPNNKQKQISKTNLLYKRTTNDVESCCSSSQAASQLSVNTFASSLQSPKEVCNVRLGSSVSRNSWAAPSPIASTRRLKQNSTSLKQSHMLKKDGLKRSSLEVNTVGDESIITEIASSKELAV